MKHHFIIANESIRQVAIDYIRTLPIGAGINTDTEARRKLEFLHATAALKGVIVK